MNLKYKKKIKGDMGIQKKNILLNEANIYKELRFIKNIGKMKDYFIINDKSYLVLNLYDKNLLEINVSTSY